MGNGPSTIALTLSGWTLIDSGETPLHENFYIFVRKDTKTIRVIVKPLYTGGYKLTVIENYLQPDEVQTSVKGDLGTVQTFLENRWGENDDLALQPTPAPPPSPEPPAVLAIR